MKILSAQFLPVAVLGFGVLLVSGVREQFVMPPVQPMSSISKTMLGLEGKDQVVGADERRIAGMTDYVMRSFGPDSAPLFSVYVGYYDRQVQGKAIHSPKNCMPGAGWEPMESGSIPLPGGDGRGKVNRVILANGGAQALVYYWYQGRGRAESSEYRVKWDLLRDAARFGRTEEALVRIVVPIAGSSGGKDSTVQKANVAAADKIAQDVAAALAPSVDRVMPAFPGL